MFDSLLNELANIYLVEPKKTQEGDQNQEEDHN